MSHLDEKPPGLLAEHGGAVGPRAGRLVGLVGIGVVVAIDDPVLDGDGGDVRGAAGGEGGPAPSARLRVKADDGGPYGGEHGRHLLVGADGPRQLQEHRRGQVGLAQIGEADTPVREGLAYGGPAGELGPDPTRQRRSPARLAGDRAAEIAVHVDVALALPPEAEPVGKAIAEAAPAERGARSHRHHERAESAVFPEGGDQAIEVMLVGARRSARFAGALAPEGGVRQEKRDGGGGGRGRRAGERGLGGGGPGLDRVPARAPPHVGHAAMPGAPHRAAMEEDSAGQARPRDEEGLVRGQAVRLDLVRRLDVEQPVDGLDHAHVARGLRRVMEEQLGEPPEGHVLPRVQVAEAASVQEGPAAPFLGPADGGGVHLVRRFRAEDLGHRAHGRVRAAPRPLRRLVPGHRDQVRHAGRGRVSRVEPEDLHAAPASRGGKPPARSRAAAAACT
jgi:hypothetical protein